MAPPPSRSTRVGAVAQIAVALVVGAAAAALDAACGGDGSSTTVTADGGQDSGSLAAAECPKGEPHDGEGCLLPEGTSCDFGLCGTRIAVCSRGAWKIAGNARPSPPCSELPPPSNAPCPACWPPPITCTYGSTDCSAEDASVNTTIASCPSGTWLIDVRPCKDGGGPDVQGDARLDAD